MDACFIQFHRIRRIDYGLAMLPYALWQLTALAPNLERRLIRQNLAFNLNLLGHSPPSLPYRRLHWLVLGRKSSSLVRMAKSSETPKLNSPFIAC